MAWPGRQGRRMARTCCQMKPHRELCAVAVQLGGCSMGSCLRRVSFPSLPAPTAYNPFPLSQILAWHLACLVLLAANRMQGRYVSAGLIGYTRQHGILASALFFVFQLGILTPIHRDTLLDALASTRPALPLRKTDAVSSSDAHSDCLPLHECHLPEARRILRFAVCPSRQPDGQRAGCPDRPET